MGYKLLGYVVWHGARFYLRRRYPDAPKKLAIGGAVVSAVAVGVVVVAQRQRGGE